MSDEIRELQSLRGCLRDLVALSALPALWVNLQANEIAASFLDLLTSALRLELAYARFTHAGSQPQIEVARTRARDDTPEDTRRIGALLEHHLEAPNRRPLVDPSGRVLRLAVAPLGIHATGGSVVAASDRSDFPTAYEQLLLNVAANQAAVWLQGARIAQDRAERSRLTALSEAIGQSLIQALPLPDMLQRCADAMIAHLDAAVAQIWTTGDTGRTLERQAQAGCPADAAADAASIPVGAPGLGVLARDRTPYVTNTAAAEPDLAPVEWMRRNGLIAFAGYPLVAGDRLVGVVAVFARRPLADSALEALATIAKSMAVGIERTRAEEALRASQARLADDTQTIQTLYRVGTTVAAELKIEKVVQMVTDAATGLTTAAFGAFFYNVIDRSGGSFLLYSLSGAPRESFAAFPNPRATALFGPTFRGEGVIRLADVTKDDRFGKNAPFHGMPRGHLPVRSYLAVPVKTRDGETIGGLFFGHPQPGVFTERHEHLAVGVAAWASVALENARLYERAQEATRARDEFLAVLSHELRTPLNAMLGWLRMLRQGQLSRERAEHAVAVIERNAQLQAQLVEDLLDVSRIVTGKLRMTFDAVEIAAIVRSAVDAVRPAAGNKGIELNVMIDNREDVRISGDADRLLQIVWNLLSNAVKFTPSGGRVDVGLRRTETDVEIVVRDSGIGIVAQALPFVFDRFVQAEGGLTRTHTGLGLGLSIVRALAEAHGGTVQATSEGFGRGAAFTVRLPQRRAADSGVAAPAPSLTTTGYDAAESA